MSEKFHTELNGLKQDTTEMVQFARDMLSESLNALINQDIVKKHCRLHLEKETYPGDDD